MSIKDKPLSKDELTAVAIALDELISYVDVVGYEGSLDDEELPTEKLNWTIQVLRDLLRRYGYPKNLTP